MSFTPHDFFVHSWTRCFHRAIAIPEMSNTREVIKVSVR
jgi:hypothetical protein